MIKTTFLLLVATSGILALASCTAYVDTPAMGASTTTTTTSDNPYVLGDQTTTRKTTTTTY